MEDKSDIHHNLCEDGFTNKRSTWKSRSTRRAPYMFASVGRKSFSMTINTPHSDQTKDSSSDISEEKTLDDHDELAEKQESVQVKEEPVSSGEEDTYCAEGDEDVSSGEGEQGTSGEKNIGKVEVALIKKAERNQRRGRLRLILRRSKEIPEDLRKQVVEAHKNGKGYKRISKDLDLHLSTVRKIIYKWKKFSTVATLPRSGRPTKIGAQGRRTILRHMRENTRVTAKDLKASLALDNINVHESTIRKTMSKWCAWDFTKDEATALQQE